MLTTFKILQTLKTLKPALQKEGFTILGIFGSYARDEADKSSDIDILYKIEDMDSYLSKYSGWEAINHIVEIKEKLMSIFQTDVDFVDIETLNTVGKEYILKEIKYV